MSAATAPGWAFPPEPVPDRGGLELVAGHAQLRQSIRLILETEPGERVMRPGFGCGLRRFLMAPGTPGTWATMARAVQAALATWEPRIEVERVDVGPGDEPTVAVVTVAYRRTRDGVAESVEVVLGGARPATGNGG